MIMRSPRWTLVDGAELPTAISAAAAAVAALGRLVAAGAARGLPPLAWRLELPADQSGVVISGEVDPAVTVNPLLTFESWVLAAGIDQDDVWRAPLTSGAPGWTMTAVHLGLDGIQLVLEATSIATVTADPGVHPR